MISRLPHGKHLLTDVRNELTDPHLAVRDQCKLRFALGVAPPGLHHNGHHFTLVQDDEVDLAVQRAEIPLQNLIPLPAQEPCIPVLASLAEHLVEESYRASPRSICATG